MARLRNAALATLVVQSFNWAGLLLSFVAVPLYLAWLGEERYGLLLTGVALSTFLMFADGGINWGSMLLIAQANGREDRDRIATLFRTSFPLAALSSVLACLLIGAAWLFVRSPHPAFNCLPVHPEFPGLLLGVGASLLAIFAFSPYYNLLIGLQDTALAAVYQGTGRLLGALLTLGLAASGVSLGWIYSANGIAFTFAGGAAAIHCRRRHSWAVGGGSWFDSTCFRQQLRTGLKSLVMQSGIVLWGSAPVLAISFAAGAKFVPSYTVPFTLINAPLSVLTSFSASLQPGYGEAMGRGETAWIAATVRRLLERGLLFLGLIAAGFLLLARPFVDWWTGGRLEPPPGMPETVLLVAATGTLLSLLRFALSGINRHREAALADLAGGLIAFAGTAAAVTRFGPVATGPAIAAAALLTGAWVLPRQLARALDGHRIAPDRGQLIRASLCALAAYGGAWGIFTATAPLSPLLRIALSGIAATAAFAAAVSLLIPRGIREFHQLLLLRGRSETLTPEPPFHS